MAGVKKEKEKKKKKVEEQIILGSELVWPSGKALGW